MTMSYWEEINNFTFDCSELEGKTLVISGATGMIGTYLIDAVLGQTVNCRIVALGRNEEKAKKRFSSHWTDPRFAFYQLDICKPIEIGERADYVIHAASNTHPVAYSTDPIGTITANVTGLQNLLDYALEHENKRFLFVSSVEIYGENRGDTDKFSEDYLGYLNCNTMRAGYPESKRVGEALCQAYIAQKKMDIVIPRLARVFGPTLLASDTKALSQFLHNAVSGEDIVLKSAGNQFYSYLYVSDAVKGLLTCLFKGQCGEAYNVSDASCDITLRELAEIIAHSVKRKVIFELPDAVESAGYSTATKAILNSGKINALGWQAEIGIQEGIKRTVDILKTGF